MPSFLVIYGTGWGQTAKVARFIDSVLSERGHAVTTVHVSQAPTVSVEDFDAVLVGASVNNRRHQPEVVAFVEEHREALSERPSAFFQLSFASAVPARWAREGAMDYVDTLVERTGWHPDQIGLFAGAVNYTQYAPLTRTLFKLASMVTTGDTDTSRDYEYTDWEAVERFAIEFADLVETSPEPEPTTSDLVAVLGVVGLAAVAWLVRRRQRQERPVVAAS